MKPKDMDKTNTDLEEYTHADLTGKVIGEYIRATDENTRHR
jgi:hypothetical protein